MSLSIGSMLSGFSTNNSSTNNYMNMNQGLNLSDYAAIKNGSYGKLMKAYYKNRNLEDSNTKSASDKSAKQNLTMVKSNADSLKSATGTLMDSKLWEKKTVSSTDNATGEKTESSDYDWEAITKAVKSFADSYNNVLSKVSESSNKNVLRNGVAMTNITNRTTGSMLEKVGISVGADNKLSVNEEKLKSANISDLKTLFTGNGSYADQIMTKSSAISKATENSSGIYTRNATYSSELNDLIAGSIDTAI